jgi:hypothetical protein
MAYFDYEELQAHLVKLTEERGHPTDGEWAFELKR